MVENAQVGPRSSGGGSDARRARGGSAPEDGPSQLSEAWSAHYTVSKQGAIGQSVKEEDIAWHAGWWKTNKASIGIEHAGYLNDPFWFTEDMYRASARLSAYPSKRYKIPLDRKHIIGHHEVPGCSGAGGGVSCHTDPGNNWKWGKYMDLIKSFRRRM